MPGSSVRHSQCRYDSHGLSSGRAGLLLSGARAVTGDLTSMMASSVGARRLLTFFTGGAAAECWSTDEGGVLVPVAVPDSVPVPVPAPEPVESDALRTR